MPVVVSFNAQNQGPPGSQGVGISAGSGSPISTAANLALYVDESTGNLWRMQSGNWLQIGSLKGEDGDDGAPGTNGTNGTNGAPGEAATIQVGTVTGSGPTSSPQISNAGTSGAASFNFIIPRPLWTPKANFLAVGDSYTEMGAANKLNGGSGSVWFSNGPTWFGQLCARYGFQTQFRMGQTASFVPSMNNYAVGQAGVTIYGTPTDSSLRAQITQLLADYDGAIPANTPIFLWIGTNDFGNLIGSNQSSPGLVQNVLLQAFSFPGTTGTPFTVTLAADSPSSTSILTPGGTYYMANGVTFAVNSITDSTHFVAQNNTSAYNGLSFPNETGFGTTDWLIYQGTISELTALVNSLVAAGASNIIMFNIGPDLLPVYQTGQSGYLAAATSLAAKFNSDYLNIVAPLTQSVVTLFDIRNKVLQPLIATPEQFGIKTSSVGWNNGSTDPDDYVFWDAAVTHWTRYAHCVICREVENILDRKQIIFKA
jgi:hypothetical protein